MTRSEDTLWCDGCGTEIRWSPYVHNQMDYCCRDCVEGISCRCGEIMELDEEYRDSGASMTITNAD